uniref:Uncharacterized protein n=1 Tax=Aegilops tauschii subsp. strangulata TaxID=200361 RepID=A0A453QGP4_AEGTS
RDSCSSEPLHNKSASLIASVPCHTSASHRCYPNQPFDQPAGHHHGLGPSRPQHHCGLWCLNFDNSCWHSRCSFSPHHRAC